MFKLRNAVPFWRTPLRRQIFSSCLLSFASVIEKCKMKPPVALEQLMASRHLRYVLRLRATRNVLIVPSDRASTPKRWQSNQVSPRFIFLSIFSLPPRWFGNSATIVFVCSWNITGCIYFRIVLDDRTLSIFRHFPFPRYYVRAIRALMLESGHNNSSIEHLSSKCLRPC